MHFSAQTLAEVPYPYGTLGLPPLPVVAGNLQTPEKVALGRRLFFDARLSANGEVSCGSCHQPEHAFTDRRILALGVENRRGTRNTPTLLNAAFNASQFWDGRRASLEEQVRDPLVNPLEHGLADHAALIAFLGADPDYVREFEGAFGTVRGQIEMDQVAGALASFVRSLLGGDSPFDRYFYAGDKSALSEPAIRGLGLFQGRAQCTGCHSIDAQQATFSDGQFHTVGVELGRVAPRLASLATRVARTPKEEINSLIARDADVAALGRFVVTLDPADIGKFRTPTLRNIALTAPYMHDGSVATLGEAVDHELYYRGQALGRPLVLTPAEKSDLLAFLRSLTSTRLAGSSDE